jgi:hypothetical protein
MPPVCGIATASVIATRGTLDRNHPERPAEAEKMLPGPRRRFPPPHPELLGKLIGSYFHMAYERHLKREPAWEILGRHIDTPEAKAAFDRVWDQHEREAQDFQERLERQDSERERRARWERWSILWANLLAEDAGKEHLLASLKDTFATAAILTALGGGINHLDGWPAFDSLEELRQRLPDLCKLPAFRHSLEVIGHHFEQARDILRTYASRGFYTRPAADLPPDLAAKVPSLLPSIQKSFSKDLFGWLANALSHGISLATIDATFAPQVDERESWHRWAVSGEKNDQQFQAVLTKLAARRTLNLVLTLAMVRAKLPPMGHDFSELGDLDLSADREHRQREAEQAAAAEAARLKRDASYQCCRPYKVLLEHRRTGDPCPSALRCETWSCPGCGRLLCDLWMNNVKLRLGGFDQAHIVTIEAGDPEELQRSERRLIKRIQRAGREWLRLKLDKCHTQLISDGPFKGSEAVPVAELLDSIRSFLESRIGLPGRTISSSHAWKLPRPEGSGEFAYKGAMPPRLTAEEMREIADHHEGELVPLGRRKGHRILWRYKIVRRDGRRWTQDERERLYTDLKAGEILPEIDFGPDEAQQDEGEATADTWQVQIE